VSLGAFVLTLPGLALADAQRVSLLTPSCELPGVDTSELRQAVALELQADGLLLSPAGQHSPGSDVLLLVEAACPGPDQLTLRAERGTARQSRAFRLSELAVPQRSRALSLSLAELAALVLEPPASKSTAAKAETDTEPVAIVEQDSAPVAVPAPAPSLPASSPARARVPKIPAPVRAPAWRLGLSPELRYFERTALWGARAQLERARFRYGVGLLMAPTEVAAGRVWTRLVHASGTYALPLWGDAERSLVESGPRVGLGYTFMSVRASADSIGQDARDWYADLAWTARFTAALSRSVRLSFGAEVGYGRGPIGYADNVIVAQTSGPFASAFLQSSLPL
jgi:hypothetical protein